MIVSSKSSQVKDECALERRGEGHRAAVWRRAVAAPQA